ncbi:hypothetical protein GOBAR_DD14096 [Gossypium barbadense]|nr:hypothetical protein GOBAR_DD14096 [Gossypium barbadense]
MRSDRKEIRERPSTLYRRDDHLVTDYPHIWYHSSEGPSILNHLVGLLARPSAINENILLKRGSPENHHSTPRYQHSKGTLLLSQKPNILSSHPLSHNPLIFSTLNPKKGEPALFSMISPPPSPPLLMFQLI